jgi:hypothetical protein
VASLLTQAGMALYRHRFWRPLDRAAGTPRDAQGAALRCILSANAGTTFGTLHGFSTIESQHHYLERVPVQHYDTLRPYLEAQRLGGTTALTAEAPLFYAQTSGTSGTPKYLPVTPTALRLHREEQALFSYLQYRACPAAFSGRAFGVMGAAEEGRLDSGHVVGSISGWLYESLPALLRRRLAVPPGLSRLDDYELKYLALLQLALAQPDVTYMGSPNPSTFVRLLRLLNEHRDALLDALADGRLLPQLDAATPDIRALVASRLRPAPDRASRLRRCREITFADVWPGLRLLTTWTGGSCGVPLAALRATLPPATMVMELGYQATEVRGTVPLHAEAPGGLVPLDHHYFEFAEQGAWDNGRQQTETVESLQTGCRYYVIVTTPAGLYRYFMNDLVEVAGVHRATPLLRFVQKGKGVTNVTGEKLYEAQVIDAVRRAFDAKGWQPSFYVLVAADDPPGYHLLVEHASGAPAQPVERMAAEVDRALADLNIEYAAKRQSGRLSPLTCTWLPPGTADLHRAAAVRAGQREGQLKPAVLHYRKDLFAELAAHLPARVTS